MLSVCEGDVSSTVLSKMLSQSHVVDKRILFRKHLMQSYSKRDIIRFVTPRVEITRFASMEEDAVCCGLCPSLSEPFSSTMQDLVLTT